MAQITFDGPNKIITLASGETEVTAQQIYSDWKRWVSSGDNSKYQLAFDTIGGDPLTPGINAGAYYFLRNDLGWRIRPPEEDTTIYLAGNLTPRDSAFPILIPTTGDYTVLVAGLQPVTQSVASLLTLQQDTAYGGVVYIDEFDGSAGTSFPVGTSSEPALTFDQAQTIATNLGVDSYALHGSITLSGNLENINISNTSTYSVMNFNGYRADGCTFDGLLLKGAMAYSDYSSKSFYKSCRLSNVGNLAADLKECVINQKASWHTGTFNISYCMAGEDGAEINLHGRDVKLIIRNWAGKLTLTSGTHPSGVVLVDSLSARVILDESCNHGTYSLYGVGEVTNNTTGSNVTLTDLMVAASSQDTIENKINDLTALSL